MKDDIGKEYDRFQRAAVSVVALLAQIVAVAGVALCSQWWHYIVLAFVCFLLTPLWAGMHMGALETWWKKHNEQADMNCLGDDPEQIEQSLDALDNVPITPPEISRNWPFDTGKDKKSA